MEKIRLKFKVYDYRVLDCFVVVIVEVVKCLGFEIRGFIFLLIKNKCYIVLCFLYVNKDLRE